MTKRRRNHAVLRGVFSSNDIFYMKVLKYNLKILGAWPEDAVSEVQPRYKRQLVWMRVLVFAACIPGIIAFIFMNQGKIDFFQIGHVYITLFMNIVALSRQLLPLSKNYQDVSGCFVKKLHLFYHKDRSEYAMKIHLMVHKLSHFYTMYATSMCICGLFLFNLTPLFNNILSGAFSSDEPYQLAVYYSVPCVDLERDFYGFIGVTVFNWFISVLCSAAFVSIDLYLSLMVFHIWGHIKILKYEIMTFGLDQTEMNDEAESLLIFKLLKAKIDYHRFILHFTNKMSRAFGPMLLIFYIYHQISGCLLLLECSQLDPKALLRYGPLTLIMFQQLIQLSCVFELLGVQSEQLIDAIYAVPWEDMDCRNRLVLGFFLKKLQTPIRLKAMGVASVGVRTMASILKTSLSYLAVLRTRGA